MENSSPKAARWDHTEEHENGKYHIGKTSHDYKFLGDSIGELGASSGDLPHDERTPRLPATFREATQMAGIVLRQGVERKPGMMRRLLGVLNTNHVLQRRCLERS